jgi:hypothetical protein
MDDAGFYPRRSAMGEKLVRIFEIVTEKIGLKGRFELANKTGVSMNQAINVEDTEELINIFKQAANDIYENSQKNSKE